MYEPVIPTGPTDPVSAIDSVGGALNKVGGVPNPDTAVEIFNSTLVPLLLSMIMQQKYSPDTKLSFQDEYDYVIVGGGTAGCVMANRLSENECVSVLLLEAGKIPPVLSEIPGIAAHLMLTDANWNFWTEPQEHTAGGQYENRIRYACGKGLGGSTLINGMLYSRGNKRDYDDWEAMGAKGWSYEDVRPYFQKLENNTDADLVADGSCHNVSGPVTFSRVRYTSYLRNPIIEAAKSLGYRVGDVNCNNQLGFADVQTSMRHGQRCSAAKAYLVPVSHRNNLDIITDAFVTKIEISNKTAHGVCMDHRGSFRCVKARQEVILSAGAINSPKLLMLSGVGPRKTLEKHKIPVHADLPVGYNLQDHVASLMFFTVPREVPFTIKLTLPRNIKEYLTNRSGPLASPANIASFGFHRSVDAATPQEVPNFESYFAEGDNIGAKFGFGLKLSTYEKIFLPHEANGTMWCFAAVVRPKSRGFVTIKSSDPYEDPLIDPKFLSHPQDVVDLVAGLKLCLDIAETPGVKGAGIKPFETKMPGCEDVAHDRNKYLNCYVRKFSFSNFHTASTVKMGSKSDPTTVVDPEFRVKGIKKLRVVDASTMPQTVSGNSMVPILMMAEKGSDMIKKTVRGR